MSEAPKILQTARTLDEFVIKQFRGLRDVPLRHLGLINLLVGGNNSGKTSVLEALAVFSSPVDVAAWSTIARNREVRQPLSLTRVRSSLSGIEAIRWLFPQFAETNNLGKVRSDFTLTCSGKWTFDELRAHCESIRGIPPEPPRRVNQDYEDPQGLFEDQGWVVSAELIGQGVIGKSIKVELWPSARFYSGDRGTGPHLPATLLAPYSLRNQPLQLRRLSELIESDTKLALIELLRDLDSEVRDLQIITEEHTGSPTILVKHRRSGPVPVSVMGDGFRRALAIAFMNSFAVLASRLPMR